MPETTLVGAVTMALAHAMAEDPSVVVLGEDVGVNGGVFRATQGLLERFGAERFQVILESPVTGKKEVLRALRYVHDSFRGSFVYEGEP